MAVKIVLLIGFAAPLYVIALIALFWGEVKEEMRQNEAAAPHEPLPIKQDRRDPLSLN